MLIITKGTITISCLLKTVLNPRARGLPIGVATLPSDKLISLLKLWLVEQDPDLRTFTTALHRLDLPRIRLSAILHYDRA